MMITRQHLDEAYALEDRLGDRIRHQGWDGYKDNLDHYLRLYALWHRAHQRYMRRLAAYRPLHNLACLLWHALIGPVLLCIRQAYEQVTNGKTTS